MNNTPRSKKFILWFDELTNKDVAFVGGKNASLGEMYQKLTKKKILIPNGFALTAYAYRYFLIQNQLDMKIQELLEGLDTRNVRNLAKKGYAIRQAILESSFPEELKQEIRNAYKKLSQSYKSNNVDVAVRSSATSEDLPSASFAGQQETYLNIRGEYALLESCKKCIASLFTNRAISYREDQGFDHLSTALSVGVQKMVRSDKASSGVMFTLDTESGFENVILINSAWGLGENVVKGRITPDEFYVFKPILGTKFDPIISKELGSKKERMIYSIEGNETTKNTPVSKSDQDKFSIEDKEIIQLAKWGLEIEKHYKRPMDIEWAKDGREDRLYIVQARPETVHAQKKANVYEEYHLKKSGKVVLEGTAVGFKIGSGKVQLIKDVNQIANFESGNVLVTEMTDPDWEPIMKKAAAIVTNSGGKTCHAAIVSRELGIPCIVGTKTGTEKLPKYQQITASCTEGEIGKIYEGKIPFEIKKTNLTKIPKTKTKIMLNLANPSAAFEYSNLPTEGVGLAREEFIISNYIKIHPNALLYPKRVKDPEIKAQIAEITKGYADGKEFYINKLAQGIAKIAAAFYPKDVIVRLSDFKTNEYANLIGGKYFEPVESNPMIGYRGASRYNSKEFKDAFELECKTLVKVRDKMGLRNVQIMVPFCRTVEEGKQVLGLLAKNGLERGVNNLRILVMCEIPSNVILADEFSKIFDGFSIGTNDLTQLILGLDRDSALVSHLYDERNKAVKRMLAEVIKVAHKNGKTVGICGEAPSNYPEVARFLVKNNIDSMSLEADSIIKTSMMIGKMK
ncbi:MAG: phosphoenolpyruvate synthase [Candidatus Dojkabacteria bacterium]|nr:phosphoenolpyruvate synthase [Candidatus Dojkabacteria bacterium]